MGSFLWRSKENENTLSDRAPFQESFKVMVMNFDAIVDTGEGLNRIMGHFTSIECKYKSVHRVRNELTGES